MTEASNAFLKDASPDDLLAPQKAEAFAGLYVWLLSDRAAAVNGQVIGVRADGELYLAAHPAALEPTLTRAAWSFEDVDAAFASGALAPPQPLGFTRLRAEPGAARAGYTGVLKGR